MLDGDVVRPESRALAPAIRITVVAIDGYWRLFLNGERVGRFDCRQDAMRCALDVARETRLDGSEVEVLAEDGFGELALTEGASWSPRPATSRARA